MDRDMKNGDVSSGYGFMNIHTDLQQNGLKSLIKYNDIDINYTLYNVDVSIAITLLSRHNILQDNESSNMSEMNVVVVNGDINGDNCYLNNTTGYESNNHNSIDYTN